MKIKHGATIVLEFITIGLSDEGNILEKGVVRFLVPIFVLLKF